MTTKIWIDGSPSNLVHATDRGLSYGDGVFTTLPVQSGAPLFLPQHLDRLVRDATGIKLPPPDTVLIGREIRSFLEKEEDGILKVLITRGQGGRGYLPPSFPAPTRLMYLFPPRAEADCKKQGLITTYSETVLGFSPSLAGIKHLNRLEQVLARSELEDGTFDEGLMRDPEGFVVEGTMSNLFGVRDGQVLTPRLDRCGVRGVMRDLVIDALRSRFGVEVQEVRLKTSDLDACQEIFLTNGVIGILPVLKLNQRTYQPGPLVGALRDWLEIQQKLEIQAWANRVG